MESLKLAVFDAEDLAIVSAHLQDAEVRVGDLAYLPGERRFALVMGRFDWTANTAAPGRRLAGLHFERVLAVRTKGIDRSTPDARLKLLAVTFRPTEAPSGQAMLLFEGESSVQLEVECLEALMKDLGPAPAAAEGDAPARDPETA